MNNDLSNIEQRVKRYWYSDGIAELSIGGMFILLGLYFGIQGYYNESSLVSVILQISLVLITMAGIFGVRWLINMLKTRLTYPRTGYVEYHAKDNDAKQRRYVVIGVGLPVAIISIILAEYIHGVDSNVLVTGVLAGVVLGALRGKSSGVTRFYALGTSSFVLGIGLSFSGFSEVYNLALFYGLMGVVIMASGGLVLRRYLRENPIPSDEGDDNE